MCHINFNTFTVIHYRLQLYIHEAQQQVMVVGKVIYLDVTKFIYVRYLIIFILFFFHH